MSDDEYVQDEATLDALCTAADSRAAQYLVPDATDDDLALADTAFVNDVHRALLRSTWLAERLAAHDESVRADAWDEGMASGIAYQAGSDDAWINPYRIGAVDTTAGSDPRPNPHKEA